MSCLTQARHVNACIKVQYQKRAIMTGKMDRHNSKSQKVCIRRFWRYDQHVRPMGSKQVAVLRKNHSLFLNLTK